MNNDQITEDVAYWGIGSTVQNMIIFQAYQVCNEIINEKVNVIDPNGDIKRLIEQDDFDLARDQVARCVENYVRNNVDTLVKRIGDA